jgi:hypothetical protein
LRIGTLTLENSMNRILLSLSFAATLLAPLMQSSTAHAQASRTWVSGVGDDANPCSRTAPCKTFAGAISKTAPGGEIDALDPGGFGAVTITKAITIDGGGGAVASVLVAGTNGIIVQAGPNDVVTLRNLRINGIGTGLNGIRFLAGAALIVDRCDIFGFTGNGVDINRSSNGTALVKDSTFANIGNVGVNAVTTTGLVLVEVSRSSFAGNFANGVFTSGGVNAADKSVVTVSNSTFNSLAFGANAAGTGILTVDSSVFASVQIGVAANASTVVAVTNNTIANATTGFQVAGSFVSAGNNKVIAGTPGTPNGTITIK